MNRLRSYSDSLREVFENTVTVRYIASSLASFDAERTARKIQLWLQKRDFDEVGIRENGIVTGYAHRDNLQKGRLGYHCVKFEDNDIVSADLPMLEALQIVRERRRVFVKILGEINGIVTSSDVVKPPIRLWLFGLLTIFEMQVTRLIKRRYPNESWVPLLQPKAIQNARNIQKSRQSYGTDVDLAECLLLTDKQAILLQSQELRAALGLFHSETVQDTLKDVGNLRNHLAHAHDISAHWPKFLETASTIEQAIKDAEEVSSRDLLALANP
jgi:hypothetical protein